jgi:hypothetical protein
MIFTMMEFVFFLIMYQKLNEKGLLLKSLLPNLVDEVWTNQPPLPNGTLFSLSLKYTGNPPHIFFSEERF